MSRGKHTPAVVARPPVTGACGLLRVVEGLKAEELR